MNSAIVTILKKELARFFGDKRTAFSAILLPGILIFVMYSLMGNALSNQFTVEESYLYEGYVKNLPEDMSFRAMFTEAFELTEITSEEEIESIKKRIAGQESDILVIFPEHFLDDVQTEHTSQADTAVPEVEVYYNSADTASSIAYDIMVSMLDGYEDALTNRFDINHSEDDVSYDLASEEDTAGSMFASMLPMLLLIFLYSGTLAVAPESIAGEKERGTIATLLVTPVKRSHIAIGKILALSFITLLSGASSTIGTIASLPKLMGAASENLNGSVYSVKDYLVLACVILSTVLVLVTIISIVSAFAKSIKEAQTYAVPLMVLVMLIGITAMFGGEASDTLYHYIVPLYNSVQSMIQIFQFKVVPSAIALTVCSNLAVTLLGSLILTRMFQSERIIFSK